MSVKNIIKQFATNHISLIFGVAFNYLFSIMFTVAIPVSLRLLIRKFEELADLNIEYYNLPVASTMDKIQDMKFYTILLLIIFAVSVVGTIVCNCIRVNVTKKYGEKLTNQLKEEVYGNVLKSDLNSIEAYENSEKIQN